MDKCGCKIGIRDVCSEMGVPKLRMCGLHSNAEELLDACERALRFIDGRNLNRQQTTDRLNQAIAKAEGRQEAIKECLCAGELICDQHAPFKRAERK